ncbi:hypothetical protein Tco_0084668 [Tanacetum coccineum]
MSGFLRSLHRTLNDKNFDSEGVLLGYSFAGSRKWGFSTVTGFVRQLAVLWRWNLLEPKLYIPGASTLGVSEVEGPLLVLPVTWAFSWFFPAVKALSFSVCTQYSE